MNKLGGGGHREITFAIPKKNSNGFGLCVCNIMVKQKTILLVGRQYVHVDYGQSCTATPSSGHTVSDSMSSNTCINTLVNYSTNTCISALVNYSKTESPYFYELLLDMLHTKLIINWQAYFTSPFQSQVRQKKIVFSSRMASCIHLRGKDAL